MTLRARAWLMSTQSAGSVFLCYHQLKRSKMKEFVYTHTRKVHFPWSFHLTGVKYKLSFQSYSVSIQLHKKQCLLRLHGK